MRVLQINTVCGVGSTGRIAINIHQVLAGLGHQSRIAYGRGVARNCDCAIKIGAKLDNYIHVAKTRIFDGHGFASKQATSRFIIELDTYAPDIIHLHNIHGYYLNVKLLFDYLKRAGKPVVWTLHDCWAFTGHCAYFDIAKCENWKNGCGKCPSKMNYPATFLWDKSASNFEKKRDCFSGVDNLSIVTPSNWLKMLAEQSFLGEYPIDIINNGIDLGIFKPIANNYKEKLGIQNKFAILGIASVWDARKGLDYFARLATVLSPDHVIVLVGVTQEQIREMPHNIIGITRTESVAELVQIYSSSDVFVNPTLEDNFPTTNLEALACGVPVITFNTGGSPEGVNPSCGLVVEKGDFKGLVAAIEAIRAKGKQNFSQACREQAERNFNMQDRFADYIKLYNRIRL